VRADVSQSSSKNPQSSIDDSRLAPISAAPAVRMPRPRVKNSSV